jgi:hypothetical protein
LATGFDTPINSNKPILSRFLPLCTFIISVKQQIGILADNGSGTCFSASLSVHLVLGSALSPNGDETRGVRSKSGHGLPKHQKVHSRKWHPVPTNKKYQQYQSNKITKNTKVTKLPKTPK